MLGIQPNLTARVSTASVAFTSKPDEIEADKVKKDVVYYKDRADDLDEVINNDVIPEKLKKPFKYMKALAMGIFEGGIVFWAAIKGRDFIKNLSNNKNTKSVVETLAPIKDGFKETSAKISTGLKNQFNKFKKTDLGKKLTSWYDRFTKTMVGKKVVEFATEANDGLKSLKNKIKGVNYDKATNITAATIATGSGVATTYVEGSKVHAQDSKDSLKKSNVDDDDYYNDYDDGDDYEYDEEDD